MQLKVNNQTLTELLRVFEGVSKLLKYYQDFIYLDIPVNEYVFQGQVTNLVNDANGLIMNPFNQGISSLAISPEILKPVFEKLEEVQTSVQLINQYLDTGDASFLETLKPQEVKVAPKI